MAISLHDDILFELLNHFIRQSDVATIMLTCKSLHSAGMMPLLRFGVELRKKDQISAFGHFISVDPSARAPHVRRLSLNLKLTTTTEADAEGISEQAKVLVEIFRMTTRLEDLSIDSCEQWLQLPGREDLAEAITSCEHLRRFRVSHPTGSTRIRALMEEMKSSLIEIDLFCSPWHRYIDIIPIVSRHCDTLEKLIAANVKFTQAAVRFPRMRTLALNAFWGTTSYNYYQMAPNLRYLELLDPSMTLVDMNMREQNKALTLWKDLDHICGSLDALYSLGLSCHVKRVEVDSLSTESVQRFRTLLADTSPSRLVLHLYKYDSRTRLLSDLLGGPGAANVTHVYLHILLFKHTRFGTAEAFMVSTLHNRDP